MVDALRAAHAAVKRGGFVVDARPDASRPPRIIAGRRVRSRLVQTEDADHRDERADGAVAQVIGEGLFEPIRSGHLWHRSTFRDLAELDAYLAESGRYETYARGTRRALLPFRVGPLVLRRAIKYQVMRRA